MTYICEGTIVKRKHDNRHYGTVLSVDRKNKVVVVQAGKAVWADKARNLEVVSYQEVQ